jgi:hypothetical protein
LTAQDLSRSIGSLSKRRAQAHRHFHGTDPLGAHLDEHNLLRCEFCRPIDIEPGFKEDIALQLTEGWILGASPTVRTQ